MLFGTRNLVPVWCQRRFHIYASGNLAADMYCNVAAEATGRTLAVRLYNATTDAGMKEMLSFMIARTPCTSSNGSG